MTLSTINRHAVAVDLLSLQARVNIIEEVTGISARILRKAFFEMHHRSPPSGSSKFTTNFIFKSFQKTKQATLFLFFFRIEDDDEFYRRCINAYRRYDKYIFTVSNRKPLLSFSDSWMIAKWSECGTVKLVRCGHCRSAKLVSSEFQSSVCSVCKH